MEHLLREAQSDAGLMQDLDSIREHLIEPR